MDVITLAQKAPDFRYESFDTCVLNVMPSVIAIILRTYHDFNSHEPVANCLIIMHAVVPDDVMQSFLLSGIPPKGYVFVRFAKQEFGHCLASEQDIHLVSRSFAIGDTVKLNADDNMIGTVISIQDSYVLEPICDFAVDSSKQQQKPHKFQPSGRKCNDTCISQLPPYISHPAEHNLLYDVPGDELKRAEDFEPADYVIERDYLGIVQDHDIDAVILLENDTVVMVENAWELELVVPDFDRPLIALPVLDRLHSPDVGAQNVAGKAFVPPQHLSRGQFVITNHRNLKNGRWLVGDHDPTCCPQGRVLDVRTRRAHIKWLCPNAYIPSSSGDRGASALRPYDNLSTYKNPRDLRRTKGLTLLDRGQRPPPSADSRCPSKINTGQDLEAGDQVRFRDLPGVLAKYQGHGHGQYHRTSRDRTFGFDMNEFIVLFSKQNVKIRWQDGSTTEQPSVLLRPYVMPEQEFCPGEIITLKEWSTQVVIGQPEDTATEFNEMLYFQGDHILKPEKVGVIQSVNARERLVRVRWFQQPSVRLLQQGNVLQTGAYFGPVSDDIDDVSMYEIMGHPALMWKRRDLVILPPQKPPIETLKAISHHPRCLGDERFGSSLLSWMRPPSGIDMYSYLRGIAKPIASRDLNEPSSVLSHEDHHRLDWVGEIVDLGLDGLLTVRLCAFPYCEDILVPWERVLTVVDEEGAIGFPSGAPDDFTDEEMDDDQYLTDDSVVSAIEETIEYEGGNRIDDESGDEGWSTDAGEEKSEGGEISSNLDDAMDVDTAITSVPQGTYRRGDGDKQENVRSQESSDRQDNVFLTRPLQQEPMLSSPPEESASIGRPDVSHLSNPELSSNAYKLMNLAASRSEPPASFLVLDTPPPPDQFHGVNQSSSNNPALHSQAFLRRIHLEHRILSSSLPSTQIYIRTYESRLDLLRALILGPADTPYEYAPFLVDLYLPPTYPSVPPTVHFHSWTSGLGRINPNLYEEGKICLSLLGTWPGRGKDESDTWTEKANILQVLLSLMGLVLVKSPFYNEAGFEGYESEGAYKVESLLYNEKAYVMARGFVKHALLNRVAGVEDVLAWVYLPHYHREGGEQEPEINGKGKVVISTAARPEERPELLRKLIQRAKALMGHSSTCTAGEKDRLVDGAGQHSSEAFIRPLSQGAMVMLKRHLEVLEKAFMT